MGSYLIRLVMRGLEEIKESVMKFICEKEYIQQQILETENERSELAQRRNEAKRSNTCNDRQIAELGQRISELGNESQELQNKLNLKSNEIKIQLNLVIDNTISENIRKIRIIDAEIQELKQNIEIQKERKLKYELQKEEFYKRFGRMPELSESASLETKTQEKRCLRNSQKIRNFEAQIQELQKELETYATIRKAIKEGNWNFVIELENPTIQLDAIENERVDSIEEFYVEEFQPIEELYVEEFQPIEEINVEQIHEQEKPPVDEIEKIARAIVEEIAMQQEKQAEASKVEDIITFKKEEKKENKVIVPLFGQRAKISNIIVKIDDEELVYKAQMSDGEEIKICPAKLGTESVLLRDQQNREECEEILINYSISEHKELDKQVIAKIDPLICELLIECADQYGYDAQKLIYNYAMSFANVEVDDEEMLPGIIYNLSNIEKSKLSKKEKAVIKRICKNARNNYNIEIIETITLFKKIKYVLKRIFAVNNVNVLPEAKY